MALSFRDFFIISLYFVFILKFSEPDFIFPTNSCFGLFAAIAIPLDLPYRGTFFSFNLEANYNLPYEDFLPPILTGITDDAMFGTRQCTNCTLSENSASSENTVPIREGDDTTTVANDAETTTEDFNETTTESTTTQQPKTKNTKERHQRSLLSRTHFYRILLDKIKRSGFDAEGCLLRLICETNSSDLGDINGILGNIVHIIFSPSTSVNEHLPLAYYKAEIDGVHDQCKQYRKRCKKNLLNLISKPLIDIVQNMMPNK